MYLDFDETEGPNPIANADHSPHQLAAADGESANPPFPTSFTYHGLQLTPLRGTSRIFNVDAPNVFVPAFNNNDTLFLAVDSIDPPVGSLTISAAAGSFSVFSLYTYALACGGLSPVSLARGRRLTQSDCPGAEVQIIGTLAGVPVDACNVGTISLLLPLPQYVTFPPGCVLDTLQFVPKGVFSLAIDNIVACAASADSSLTLAA